MKMRAVQIQIVPNANDIIKYREMKNNKMNSSMKGTDKMLILSVDSLRNCKSFV